MLREIEALGGGRLCDHFDLIFGTSTGAMISVSDVGIIISNGKGAVINMTGPTVDVNLGALTVI